MSKSENEYWPLVPVSSERRGFLVLGSMVLLMLTGSWLYHLAGSETDRQVQYAEQSYPLLNRASAGRLEEIPGVGLERARRIVAYRRQDRTITRFSELQDVEGIGPETIRTLRRYTHLQPGDRD